MSKRGFKTTITKPEPQAAVVIDEADLPRLPHFWRMLLSGAKLAGRNAATALAIFLLPLLLQVLGRIWVDDFKEVDFLTLRGIALEAFSILLILFNLGLVHLFTLRAVRGERPGIISSYRHGMYYWPRVMGLGLVVLLFAVLSLLALVIPGLIVIRRYALAGFFLVEDDLGIRQAMMRCADVCRPAVVRRYIWQMLTTYVLLGVLGWYLTQWFDIYGQTVAYVLFAISAFAPAVLYQAILDRKAAASATKEK
jgi:hypothetical protein